MNEKNDIMAKYIDSNIMFKNSWKLDSTFQGHSGYGDDK